MRNERIVRLTVAALLLCAAVLSSACSKAAASGGGDGKVLVSAKCRRCHTLGRVDRATKNEVQWLDTVERMRSHGLSVTDAEKQAIATYLAQR